MIWNAINARTGGPHGWEIVAPATIGAAFYLGNTADIASLARKPLEFIADMKDTYRIDNEIMFRRGIPKEKFTAVTCDTEAARQRCIDALLNAGIKEVNGIDIYDFVKVQEEI